MEKYPDKFKRKNEEDQLEDVYNGPDPELIEALYAGPDPGTELVYAGPDPTAYDELEITANTVKEAVKDAAEKLASKVKGVGK